MPSLSITAPKPGPFSSDYLSARARFRSASERAGCAVEQQSVPGVAPGGEPLTIDVARCGEPSPERVLVVSSGLHGVEGLFGSAVQAAWLQACAEQVSRETGNAPPTGSAVVLIHALNPWGFAHLRRTDEHNVDLNRNLLVPGEEFAGSPPLYGRLNAVLNPERPPRRIDPFPLQALGALMRYGRPAVTQAVAGGQYGYPRGLFFGGHAESETARILRAALPRWLGNASHVLHLDLHTGLGPWATYQLLADYRLSDDARQVSRELSRTARHVIEPAEARSFLYRSGGGLGGWCRAAFPDRHYLLFVAEFGTYPPFTVLSALRAENQAHHFCRPGEARYLRAKQRLREVFCPASDAWRSQCVTQALTLIRSATAALRSWK